MTIKELIKRLETLPEDYEVIYESGDRYGSTYYAYVNEIIAHHKAKEVELCE